jgi:uncharacterized DUF497 family protein
MRSIHYDFEWDREKAWKNVKKHGVAFEEAATVFLDRHAMTVFDHEHSDDEDRWITLGISKSSRLLVVCHTYRKESEDSTSIRIFSSRKATKKETSHYMGDNLSITLDPKGSGLGKAIPGLIDKGA